jgi:phosphatidylglycerophosphate synthase
MVLDRADGELARLSGKTSPGGHTYDLVSDALSNGLAFVGLGVGYIGTALGFWAGGLGFLAGGAVATILLMVMRAEASHGSRSAELQGAAGFDPDDAIIVVPIAVLLGGGEILLISAAVGAPLFAGFFFWRFRDTFRSGH